MISQSVNALKKTFRYSFLHRAVRTAMIKWSMGRWTQQDEEMAIFYGQFIKPGDLCFDIGANMGNRTKIFLKLGARIVVVEPQNHCMAFLKKQFGENRRVVFVHKAVGEREDVGEMMISGEHTISSLSATWVERVQQSGRFSQFDWPKRQRVEVTTIDALIQENGRPAFIKIDIEGYEYEAIKGMSIPARALSFEFTPEFMDATYGCIERLSRLGDARFNYTVGETMKLKLPVWTDATHMVDILSRHENDGLFGDVLAKFPHGR